MPARVTIKTLARDLGLSHMTVSRALSGTPNVNPATRRAILARAEAAGYVRSGAASAMRGGASRIVGLLLPNIVNDFYASFADALAEGCAALDLQLIVHITRDDPGAERQAMLRLREVGADAILAVPVPGGDRHEAGGTGTGRLLHLIRARDGHPALLIEDATAIAMAVDHLAALGHVRFGYIGAGQDLSSGRARLAAFRAAAERNGLTLRQRDVVTQGQSFQAGVNAARRLLAGPRRPTALICGGLEVSNGALDACLAMGLAMPAALAFVGYGDPAHYRWLAGGITTVALPIAAMARTALRALSQPPSPAGEGGTTSHRADLVLRATA